jgi:putative FmdB family regulatory protein
MPIFEYVCRDCDRHFETLVTADRPPHCPSCQGDALDKQLSVFAVSTKGGGDRAPMHGGCGTCGDPRGPGACSLN